MIRSLTAVLFLGALVVAPTLAATHTVNQIGTTFAPGDITIDVGDTVEWIWSAGIHTVTNGAHPDSAGTGTLFDAPLQVDAPIFSFTFTEPGVVPYFCRPHFLFDMTGIVRVAATAAPGELGTSTFSRVKNLYR